MLKSMTRASNKAFTLIELIVVLVILGILALIAIPKFSQVEQLAHFSSVATTAQSIEDEAVALGAFTQTADNGFYSGTSGNTNVEQAATDLANLDTTGGQTGNYITVAADSNNYIVTDGSGYSVCLVPSGQVGVTGVTWNMTAGTSTNDTPASAALTECAAATSTSA
jgi:type IV pilus assembly protein PilA